ncbi:HAMP domain-containing sensor histidine kinase [Gelidibacter sp.]|uniref:sensor histidine kinase n=1 Tax=Gelidibacter sp. TaxID=2018083 RepID=UPI00326394AB
MTDQIQDLKIENKNLKNEINLLTGWISLISHDTKQMFSSLTWIIDAYESEIITEEVFFKMLPEIKKDANKNLQTAIDTGEWLKTQYGNFQPKQDILSAKPLFEELRETFEEKLKKKDISLSFIGHGNLQIVCDKVLITFILSKLLDNAIKYSNVGQEIIFTAVEEANEIVLSVTDFGTGIVEKYLNSIYKFENPVFHGTAGEIGAGLSLKIVQSFVFLANGTIEIDSLENKGTTVTVRLPQIDK